MKTRSFLLRLAPDRLWQSINSGFLQGAHFHWFSIDMGATPHPDTEEAILHEVGTYGGQIGRMGDVLEILLARLDPETLTREEKDALAIFAGQLAQVRKVKRAMRR